MFTSFQQNVGTLWCSVMHESPMWPIHDHYECRTCGRRYPAFAEASLADRRHESALSRPAQMPSPAAASLSRD